MGRRNEKGSRVRLTEDDILEAAKSAFAAQGYLGTNLGGVADVLGVTRQAIYYYFEKKHDILVALFERFFDRLEEAVATAVDPRDDAAGRFEVMLAAHIRTVASSPEHSAIFMRDDINLTAEEREKIQKRRRRHHDLFVDAYKQAVAEGRFTDVPAGLAVSLILGAANWTFRWFNPAGRLSPAQLAAEAAAFLAAGYVTE
jgi:TetR/AcrR family transcriptional regulator, cholesterol catabolism regulator